MDGLTYHLDTCTLDSFITTLKECSAAGSCMAFDYVSLCATDGECKLSIAKGWMSSVTGGDRRIRTGIEEGKTSRLQNATVIDLESLIKPRCRGEQVSSLLG